MYNGYGMYMPAQQIIRVNGQAGAQTLNLPPNSSALVLDETAPLVWLCKTDGAGYKSCTPFSIAEYKPAPPIDVNVLAGRIERLEEIINESNLGRSERAANAAESARGKRTTNVSGVSNSGKSGRIHASDDGEEPDPLADRE